jgi:outer membrane protein assembly factor BamB
VIIVDDATGKIVWQYGEDGGVSGNGSNQLSTPVAAVLVPGTGSTSDHILITDQGNNRIIEVDETTKDIVWQFPPLPSHAPGDAGDASDAADAGIADAADAAETGVVDAAEASVADASGGATEASVKDAGDASAEEESGAEDAGEGGASDLSLNSPNSAERLANGDTLIADESNNRVIEVTTDGKIVWQYPKTLDAASLAMLNVAGFASRLTSPSGHTLISDTNNNRIIEVIDSTFKVFWQYSTANRNPNNPMPNPSCAVRLKSGNTLITDQFNHQVIEVTPESKIVWQYGQIGVAGAGKGQLNTPYHAVDIGDYTGLTDPSP